MPSCDANTPNIRTPCTSSNAKSLTCKAGSTSSKNSTNDSPRNAISSWKRYYRLVTQFELIGGGVDRARAGVSDTIGLLRGRPENHEPHELSLLPAAKSLSNTNGQLEDGIAKIAATLSGEHGSAAE
jgi:hypothetical protein